MNTLLDNNSKLFINIGKAKNTYNRDMALCKK